MKQHKKILFIVPRFGSIQRGAESFVADLSAHLDKSLFDITILSAPHQMRLPQVKFIQGSALLRERLYCLDKIISFCPRIFGLFGIRGSADIEAYTLLKNFKKFWPKNAFDIVVPLGGTWSYKFARKRFPDSRIISIGQSGPVDDDLRLSDFFIALTKHDRDRVCKTFPNLNSATIPNGINLERFDIIPSHNSDPGNKIILCVAALVKEKRHDLLFDAVLLLPGTVSILCVGSGPYFSELKKHPLVAQGRVKFESCAFSEMPSMFKKANIFSLPSPVEAFGIVFIEAMASGLQVVAHSGTRQREILGEVGIFCDVHNSNKYAAALDAALINPCQAQEIRKRALDFDWKTIANKYTDIFMKI